MHDCKDPPVLITQGTMSALKDIMDVDVEPLDSQAAYRRAKEASRLQVSHPPSDQPSASPSPLLDDDDNKGKATKRCRSHRISNSGPPNIIRPRSSAACEEEVMDFNSGDQVGLGVGGSNPASISGSPQQSSRGSEQPILEMPVKYTPVTGRISRAKKGIAVHTCDICRPVKVSSIRHFMRTATKAFLDIHQSGALKVFELASKMNAIGIC